jgi:tetratricopeptide (TPR) repeat protein
MDESSDDSSSSDDEVEEVVDAAALRRQAMGGGRGGKGQEPVIKKGFFTANKANTSKENTQADGAPALHANKLTEREREKKIDEFQARVQQNVALKVEIEAAKGLKLLSDGQYAKAVEHLSSAIEEAGVMGAKAGRSGSEHMQTVHVDDTVKWLLARGKCYLEMGECYNAIPDLGKAVSLDGASVEARLQYAIALRFACQYVEASEQIKQLLRLDPGHAYGKLEQRRLEQRLAHAQGRDLDTWRRKDSVITTAKDIQARAEKSIQESRSRVEQAGQRDKEKEFEEAFFKQIAEAKQRQEEEREQLASRAGALLDVGLNGIDVDELLRELKALKPDENFLKHASPGATPNGRGSDAGRCGGGGGGGGDGAHEPRPSLPRTGPPPDLSEEEAKQLEDLFRQVKASENAAVQASRAHTLSLLHTMVCRIFFFWLHRVTSATLF